MIVARPLLPLLIANFAFSPGAKAAPRPHPQHSYWTIVHKVRLGQSIGWAIGNTKGSYATLKTTDGGQHWRDVSPSGFWPRGAQAEMNEKAEEDGGSGADTDISFFSPDRGAVAAVDSNKDGDAVAIRVASTLTGGHRWLQTRFRVPDWVESLNLQFTDARHGFLLALSSPAAGLMEKRVYQTSDGNQSWHVASDGVAPRGSFYPTGMSFRNALNGWIAATYHGEPDVPLYRTEDGGRTWHLQSLPEPAVYKNGGYGNTYPPRFFGPQRRDGTLAVDYKNNDRNRFETIVYVTRDGGRTWRIGRRKRTRSED